MNSPNSLNSCPLTRSIVLALHLAVKLYGTPRHRKPRVIKFLELDSTTMPPMRNKNRQNSGKTRAIK
jgi:hypothetical protein